MTGILNGVESIKRIDMHIDHDRSVYRGLFCERDDANHRRVAPYCLFSLFPARRLVGHVLVLVFAAMLKDSALRAAWVGERAGRHVFILKFDFVNDMIIF